jgi:hypothetical protein
MKLTAILTAVASVILLALSGGGAVAQTARTIRLVVPFPAGGSGDDLARLLADQVGRSRGVNFVIENRPGAGTVVATEAVSRAAPDGNAADDREFLRDQSKPEKAELRSFRQFRAGLSPGELAAHHRGEQRLALSKLR